LPNCQNFCQRLEEHYAALAGQRVEVFKFLMEEHQLDLSSFPEIGQAGEVAKRLSGQRKLTVAEIRALSYRFGVSPASFIG
jgi:HTH-type transcriptional regulator/antitoxin HigA